MLENQIWGPVECEDNSKENQYICAWGLFSSWGFVFGSCHMIISRVGRSNTFALYLSMRQWSATW